MSQSPNSSYAAQPQDGFQNPAGQQLGRYRQHIGQLEKALSTYGAPRNLAWNLPWGEIAYAQVTANQAGIGAEADVTSLTTGSITYRANRIIEVRMSLTMNQQTGVGNTKVFITDGSNNKLAAAYGILAVDIAAGSRATFDRAYRVVTTATAITYKLRATTSAGTCTVLATATGDPGPAFIQVTDLGPAGIRPPT